MKSKQLRDDEFRLEHAERKALGVVEQEFSPAQGKPRPVHSARPLGLSHHCRGGRGEALLPAPYHSRLETAATDSLPTCWAGRSSEGPPGDTTRHRHRARGEGVAEALGMRRPLPTFPNTKPPDNSTRSGLFPLPQSPSEV